jgi:hypothetical protein
LQSISCRTGTATTAAALIANVVPRFTEPFISFCHCSVLQIEIISEYYHARPILSLLPSTRQ